MITCNNTSPPGFLTDPECWLDNITTYFAILGSFVLILSLFVNAIRKRYQKKNTVNKACRPIPHLFQAKILLSIIFLVIEVANLFLNQLHGSKLNQLRSICLIILTSASILYAYFHRHSSPVQTNVWFLFVFMPIAISMIFKTSNVYSFEFCISVVLCIVHGISALAPDPCMALKISPEVYTGYLSTITYQWVTNVLISGYKGKLKDTTLPVLRPDYLSDAIHDCFDEKWHFEQNDKNVETSESSKLLKKPENRKSKSLFMTLVKVFGRHFLYASSLKVICDILQFVSPKLLGMLMAFVSDDTQNIEIGFIISVLFFGKSLVSSFTEQTYFAHVQSIGMNMRSALVCQIYHKSINQDAKSKRDGTVGEMVNLMSVDCEVINGLMMFINVIWSSPLQICLAMYFLWQELGVATLAGLFFMLLLMPLNIFVGKYTRSLSQEQMKLKDERINITNEALTGIKLIKLYGWEEPFRKRIEDIRNKELASMRKMAIVNSISGLTWAIAPLLVTLITFMVYTFIDENNILSAPKIFVCLVLFNIMRFPMTMLPNVINWLLRAHVSLKRIEAFLNLPELSPNKKHPLEKSPWLKVEDGSFHWGDKDKMILKNINVNLKEGGLIAIVGNVGSGKSSVIQAMLGNMCCVGGSVGYAGNMAYIPQEAWIQNASVRDNITFGCKYNKQVFKHILDMTGMEKDIMQLPNGFKTLIGEKGISLSGGQKQRISIARALYATYQTPSRTIYFFDDPLSALDAHVASHVFDNVIGNQGHLQGTLRVLVTNSLNFLPKCDTIYVVNDGCVAETGTYEELIVGKSKFSSLLREFTQSDESATSLVKEKPTEKIEAVTEELADVYDQDEQSNILVNNPSQGEGIKQYESVVQKYAKLDLKKEDDDDDTEGELDDEKEGLVDLEEVREGAIKSEVFINYFKAIGIYIWALVAMFYTLNHTCGSLADVWLSRWDDASTNLTGEELQTDSLKKLSVYGGIGGGQALFAVSASITLAMGSLIASRKYHGALLEKILYAPMSFFDTTPLGNILNRIGNDIFNIDSTIPGAMSLLTNLLFLTIANVCVILYTVPWFILVLLPTLVIYYLVQRFFVATSRQLKRIESKAKSPIYSHFQETIQGQSTIRAFQKDDEFKITNQDLINKHHQCYYMTIQTNRWMGVRLDFLNNLIVLSACIFAVLGREQLTAGLVGLCVTYSLSVTRYMNFLIRTFAQAEANIVSIERVEGYLNDVDQEKPHKLDLDKTLNTVWPVSGAIQFKGYTARYRKELPVVVRDITVDIPPGTKVGICGRTGAGKSSLTVALFRLIEGDEGSIIIDGTPIDTLGLHKLRSSLAIIPQEPILFTGTIRNNLDPWNEKTDSEIWECIEKAHLKGVITASSEGLEMEISEGGSNLSVGQRQLVCLGRALLSSSKVLVLDEATAAMDMETDQLLQKTIRTDFKEATTLTIAHRINTIMDSDKILVLDQGCVAEYDTPDNLLSQGGIFASLVAESKLD